jgi:hypothetical protein
MQKKSKNVTLSIENECYVTDDSVGVKTAVKR